MSARINIIIVLVAIFVVNTYTKPSKISYNDNFMHPHTNSKYDKSKMRPREDTAEFWKDQAQATIKKKLSTKLNTNIAKNVIIFLGDGMSIPTLMAARVWKAQKEGLEYGEENSLSFEEFPYTGLSKTYCVNKQVGDSACTVTAYLGGVKANEGTIGVTATVKLGDCAASLEPEARVESIAKWSQVKGKKTGVVTTAAITDASPVGMYAHTAHRDWENNVDIITANATDCKDIAHQLIYGETGQNLNVILGGGRRNFYMQKEQDPEGISGSRTDENLIEKWKELKSQQKAEFAWNRNDLLSVPNDTEYLLGLFEPYHCQYELDRNKETDPSLTDMVEKAVNLLHNSEKGYFLFVEGGRIDHAHHGNLAMKAMDETLEFSNAIQKALELTSMEDTLIVVTSDHAHTMSVSGYAVRGNNILGQSEELAQDGIPYSTINYANGPGYRKDIDGVRYDISKDNTDDKEYQFPSIAPLGSETHGGDDVGIFAIGPWAHLLTGTVEQNVIAHVMAYASCVGEGATACD